MGAEHLGLHQVCHKGQKTQLSAASPQRVHALDRKHLLGKHSDGHTLVL